MGLLNFISGVKNRDHLLISKLENYTKSYTLKTENQLMYGSKSQILKSKTETKIRIDQEIYKNRLFSKVTILNIKGETESDEIKTVLNQALILSEISPSILFKRNLDGELLQIENTEQLTKEWNSWKKTKLREVFQDKRESERFVKNYEKGLCNMSLNIFNNLTYKFVLPECLNNKSYISKNENISASKCANSKLISNLHMDYFMHTYKLTGENDDTIHIKSKIKNKDILTKDLLKKLPFQNENYTFDQYAYKINKKYKFNRNTSEIISGKFSFKESIHNEFYYNINMIID